MNGRGLGVVDALAEALPQVIREAFVVLTQLGDAWFIFVATALVYWYEDRDRGAFVLAAVLGALALTVALKGLFGLPRPPAELHVGHADSYGFPSGHAVGSSVLWVVLALVLDRGTRAQRLLVAGAAVAVVATSRVVIGVHYTVDVVVGVAVGLAYLGLLVRATDWEPGRGFAVASAVAAGALATNGLTPDAVAIVAGVLGATAAWSAFGVASRGRVGPGVALATLAGLGALGYAGNSLSASLAAVFVLNLVVPPVILLLPVAVERVKRASGETPT
ncbi:phosphatase PAP2 family protein [Halorussus marinus]|uniref:phosphatase PAP2 family protein n=1 Tax=Halorussus marinus TaxID=2505976 RepID=UPI00106E8339|nr:phosphatase PAP2 family protein [Halorussus marinus]